MGSDDNDQRICCHTQAPVFGQSPGAVDRLSHSQTAFTAVIPVPGAHYLVPSPSGNQILVFSDNSNSVTLLFPALLGTGSQTNTQTPCSGAAGRGLRRQRFRPAGMGRFQQQTDQSAYIFNCGLECGGTSNASIAPLNMSAQTLGTPIPLVSGGLIGGATDRPSVGQYALRCRHASEHPLRPRNRGLELRGAQRGGRRLIYGYLGTD